MKKYIALVVAGICLLTLAGCGTAATSVGPGKPIAAHISDQVTKVEMTHMHGGQMENWVVEGADLETLRTWANGLKYEHITFAEGESPAEGEGAEVYSLDLTEGDYPGFAYYCGDKDHSYLRIEGEWYKVSNPSAPPVELPPASIPNNVEDSGEIPKQPPALFILDPQTGENTPALIGTYSWMYPNGDGTSTGIESDSPSPLDSRDHMPALEANGKTVHLTFAIPPDELSVRCWNGDDWGSTYVEGQPIEIHEGTLELESESQIYEVIATWNSNEEWGGKARYSFYSGPSTEIRRDLGITLSVGDVGAKALTLVCTQSGGDPTGELQTGAPFWLETYVGGMWQATPRAIEEVAFTMEAWSIPMNNTVEWNINLEWLYPDLGPGKYRIGKEIMDFRGGGDFDKYTYYAEFEIGATETR